MAVGGHRLCQVSGLQSPGAGVFLPPPPLPPEDWPALRARVGEQDTGRKGKVAPDTGEVTWNREMVNVE